MAQEPIIPYENSDKLTLKQRKWLNSYLTCFNYTQAAKEAGYNCTSENGYGVIGSENYKKLKNIIDQWVDENLLTDEDIKRRIQEGFTVTETKLNVIDKEVVETEVPARGIQQKYVDMAAKVKGIYSTGPGESEDKPLHIKVLDRFGDDKADKDKKGEDKAP